jgi:FkbM family methyltransferase
MKLEKHLVRAWQRAPLSLRRRFVSTPIAPLVGRWMNAAYASYPQVFELASPLEGYRMRLHWQTSKAYVFGTHEYEVTQTIQRGKVIAFEPLPENFAVLEENIRLNSCTNVVLENLAVGDFGGRSTLRANDENPLTSTSSLEHGRAVAPVDVIRLDDYLLLRKERVHFVMMDVEGAEAAVLRGMQQTLAEHRPVLLIELHAFDYYRENHPALLELKSHGYGFRYLDIQGAQTHILAEFQAEQ